MRVEDCETKKNCLDLRKYFFSARVVDRWNRVDQKDIDIDTVNGFKRRLENKRNTRIGFFMDYSLPPSLKALLGWTTPLLVWPHQVNITGIINKGVMHIFQSSLSCV